MFMHEFFIRQSFHAWNFSYGVESNPESWKSLGKFLFSVFENERFSCMKLVWHKRTLFYRLISDLNEIWHTCWPFKRTNTHQVSAHYHHYWQSQSTSDISENFQNFRLWDKIYFNSKLTWKKYMPNFIKIGDGPGKKVSELGMEWPKWVTGVRPLIRWWPIYPRHTRQRTLVSI